MAEIAASMVMDLRQRTGLGMMECKKALTEAAGDLAKAEELLRIKSGAKASKAAGRIAAEGVIGLYVAPDAKTAAMVEVNCETDFVAKNDDFRAFAAEIAQIDRPRQPRRRRRAGRAAARVRRDDRGPPHGARPEDRREPVDTPLRAQGRRRPHRVVRPRQSDRRAGRSHRRAGYARQGSRDARRREQADGGERGAGAGRRRGEGEGDRRCACRRFGQAGEHRREDGRRRGREVPGRGHAARRSLSSRATASRRSGSSSRRRAPS